MPKASPALRAFSAGEFSPLVDARTDFDRYPFSARRLYNMFGSAQGPAMRRPGTQYLTPVFDETTKSAFVPFVYSNEDYGLLEFSPGRMRIIAFDGLQTYDGEDVDEVTQVSPMKFDSASLDAEIGDQVQFSDFPVGYTINGKTATVTAKAGTIYTLDIDYDGATGVVSGPQAYRVFHLETTYTANGVAALRFVQKADVVYLLTGTAVPRKLARMSAFEWAIDSVDFIDGPFMSEEENNGNTYAANVTGNLIPDMTGASTPAGTASASAGTAWHAFDADLDTYWDSGAAQTGTLTYAFASAAAVAGYVLVASRDNSNATYTTTDYAPGTWDVEGYDGANWILLDSQVAYTLYDNRRSGFFTIDDDTAYQQIRIQVKSCVRNGTQNVRLARFIVVPRTPVDVTLTFKNTVGINNGTGFQTTDVGRLIRIQAPHDQAWRSAKIKARTSTTVAVVNFQEDVLPTLKTMQHFRLGYWSDTTGWPTCGTFYGNRLWLGGGAPNLLVGSVQNAPENMSSTDYLGTVLDTSGLALELSFRKVANLKWIGQDNKGLLVGTGSSTGSLTGTDREKGLTALSFKFTEATERGSAPIEPVRVDDQIVYVHRSQRAAHEFTYVFERDGYVAPSLSQLASHIGKDAFEFMVYASEPHAIVWFLQNSGSLAGLTYNREEGVIGWHGHEIGGTAVEVETIAVTPSPDKRNDVLWIVAKRTIDGVTRRYIERLTEYWEFGNTIEDAFFVDSGLRYSGVSTQTLHGVYHLIGEQVVGLVDGQAFGPVTVADDGSVDMGVAGTEAVLGLHYYSELESLNPEAGAADGTAQGKTKRAHAVTLDLLDSYGGEVGVTVSQKEGAPVEYDPITIPEEPYSELETSDLFTGETEHIPLPENYGPGAGVWVRQAEPYPLNLRAIYPQLHTQDR